MGTRSPLWEGRFIPDVAPQRHQITDAVPVFRALQVRRGVVAGATPRE